MSLFESAMRQEFRETGRVQGFGAMSSAAWTDWAREAEAAVARCRTLRCAAEPEASPRWPHVGPGAEEG